MGGAVSRGSHNHSCSLQFAVAVVVSCARGMEVKGRLVVSILQVGTYQVGTLSHQEVVGG